MSHLMNFPDTVTLYMVTEDTYGDKTLSAGTTRRAAFEQVISKTHVNNQDAIVSTSRLYLPPEDIFENGYRMEGMLVKVNVLGGTATQQFFKITQCFPVRDTLLGNTVKHVECDLQKVTDFSATAVS